MPASSSSSTGTPRSSLPLNFMPSFASEPPATTTTRSYTPASTRAPAMTIACTGLVQKALTSLPFAFTKPHDSAMALAIAPPPRL